MGHRQWAGRPRVAYQPRGLDPFETLQIARTNLIAEAARIGMMPPDLRDYSSSYDPSRRLSFRAGNGSSCPEADLCASWPEIRKAVIRAAPCQSGATGHCSRCGIS